MSKATNPQQSGRNRWWSRDQHAERDRRIQQIQHINDPGTSRDEVLTATKWILGLLLIFTGSIAVFSYFKFFSQNIPPIAAGIVAVILAIVIEYGKNYLATKAVREPFFSGWGNIFSSIAETIYYAGVAVVAAVCFYVSVVNSTVGARELSNLLSFQKNDATSTFQPDTRVLDEQIAGVMQGQRDKQKITWKGTVTYQAQKAIQADGRTLEKLNAQRAAVIEQQRADFQRRQEQLTAQTKHTSGMVFQIGGWVELLQILLIFIRVSCERILVDRQVQREESANPAPAYSTAPKFNGNQAPHESFSKSHYQNRYPGFNVGSDGNVIRAGSTHVPVSQITHPVSQINTNGSAQMTAEEVLRYYEGELRKETPHFENRHARRETVINRIHTKLRNAHSTIDRMHEHSIQHSAAQRFEKYLIENLSPALEAQHGEYPEMSDLLATLQHKTAQEVAAS